MAELDSETAAAIVRDVAANTSSADSAITYGPEEEEFRRTVELEWETWRKANPGAHLVAPT